MKSLFKRHAVALIIACIVGVIYIAPHIIFIFTSTALYQGIYISRSYDEEWYDAMIRQAYDGQSASDNPYISEYKQSTVIGSSAKIFETATGWTARLLGISISSIMIVSKFIFPALLFLAVYALVFTMTGNILYSITGGIFVLLGCELAPLSLNSALNTLSFHGPTKSFLFFNRPINPQMSGIVWAIVLLLWARFWKDRANVTNAILAGVGVGLLAYVYYYYWNYTVILAGIVFIAALIYKEKTFIKNSAIALGSAILVSLPFILQMLHSLSAKSDGIQKNIVYTHSFIVEKVSLLPVILLALIFIWISISKRYPKFKVPDLSSFMKEGFVFLFMLLLSGLIASNQHVIHGFEIQQHHFHFMINIPLFAIFLSCFIPAVCEYFSKKLAVISSVIIILIVTLHGVSVQATSYNFWKGDFNHYQSYAPFFDYLNKNTAADEVVYTDTVLSEMVPMYTHDSVYSSLHASVYPVPVERLKHNYFIMMYLRGVTADTAKSYLYDETHRNELGQYIYEGQYWRAVCGSFGCFPDSVIDELISDYKNFLKTGFEKNLKKYRIDYVLWDAGRFPEYGFEKFTFLKEVKKDGDIHLYKVL